jgi:adenylylsulfate kinase
MKILIMGLPGSGKTTLAEKLLAELHKNGPAEWVNADELREECSDWDFSPEGRKRQAHRMNLIASAGSAKGFTMICDFVCPTRELRDIFDPDMVIWMDTITEGRFEDTNRVFEPPETYDLRITDFDYSVDDIVKELL